MTRPAPPFGLLRLVPGLTMAALALPVLAGLWGTVSPALRPGAMQALWDWPGFGRRRGCRW